MAEANNSNLINNREIAGGINPMIGCSDSDTMSHVASVLHYLSEIKPIGGFELSEDSEYGKELILTALRKAIMFEISSINHDNRSTSSHE